MLTLIFIALFSMHKMELQAPPYKVMPTRECIKYLESKGLSVSNFSAYNIKSHKGNVYELPDGQLMLLPTNFKADYPGIIFKDKDTFLQFEKIDSFPIGEENMTWFEKHRTEIQQFRAHPDFFSKILTHTLKISYPFRNPGDIKIAFQKIQSILASPEQKRWSYNETEEIIYSYGLGVINYLVDHKNIEARIEDRYNNYNPTAYPMVIIEGQPIDVISNAVRYLSSPEDYQYDIFAHNCRIIP